MAAEIVTACIAASSAIVLAGATYWFTKQREREAELRKEKLEHYKDFVSRERCRVLPFASKRRHAKCKTRHPSHGTHRIWTSHSHPAGLGTVRRASLFCEVKEEAAGRGTRTKQTRPPRRALPGAPRRSVMNLFSGWPSSKCILTGGIKLSVRPHAPTSTTAI